MRSQRLAVLGLCSFFLVGSGLVFAQPATKSDWIGKSVMPKSGTRFRIGEYDDARPWETPLDVVAEDGDWLILGFLRLRRTDAVTVQDAPAYYAAVLQENPRSSWAYCQRGLLLGMEGELRQALKDLDRALQLDPQNAEAWLIRGRLHATEEDPDTALRDYAEAIRLRPDYADAFHQRGTLYFEDLDDNPKALDDFDAAIRACPQYSDAYNSRGILRQYEQQLDAALADYDLALKHDPYYAHAFSNRALLRAACGDARFRDGKLAVADATRACELTQWKDAEMLDVLAAAYAEAGDFQQAVQTQLKTVQRAPKGDRLEYLQRLSLYQTKQPYRYDD